MRKHFYFMIYNSVQILNQWGAWWGCILLLLLSWTLLVSCSSVPPFLQLSQSKSKAQVSQKIKVKSQSYIEGLGLRVSLFYCAIKYLFRIVTQSSGTLVSPIVKCWQWPASSDQQLQPQPQPQLSPVETDLPHSHYHQTFTILRKSKPPVTCCCSTVAHISLLETRHGFVGCG